MVGLPQQDTRFRVSERLARELVGEFGSPLYVLDEAHLRGTIRRYKAAFDAAHPKTELVYASKANSTLAVLAIAASEGCMIDTASEGELRAALSAGVSASQCHLHGNNKTRGELEFGIGQRVGQIVVDNFGEIETIASLSSKKTPDLLLRLAPGVDPITHDKISTGQADTKFGFNIGDGSAERAVLRCSALSLPLVGFHCHVGSQLLDPEAQRSGGALIAQFAAEMKAKHGFEARVLNVGGGLGVRYRDCDAPMPVEEYSRLVVRAISEALDGSGLEPTLAQEPGRALVAESGVTLYTVGVVKTVPSRELGKRTYVCVDGGLSDNPRPALYNAAYQVERVARTSTPNPLPVGPGLGSLQDEPLGEGALYTISGKHCESDKLFEHVKLPADIAAGDILQVLCTGAYNSSMASSYNRYPLTATVLLRQDGSQVVVQRRDTWEEMFEREFVPEGLGTI